jgi:hypothetical protein
MDSYGGMILPRGKPTNSDKNLPQCHYPSEIGGTCNTNEGMIIKSKVKLSRYRHAGAKVEMSYSSSSFLNSAVDEVDRVTSLSRFTPENGPPVPTG